MTVDTPDRSFSLEERCSGMYGIASSEYGEVFWARIGDDICALGFKLEGQMLEEFQQGVCKRWSECVFLMTSYSLPVDALIESGCAGRAVKSRFAVRGTAFQLKVWQALFQIPCGETVTYRQIAEKIGHPRSFRAVGGAVAANPIAVLIPCHRVVRNDGKLGGYAWGQTIKRRLLERESGNHLREKSHK